MHEDRNKKLPLAAKMAFSFSKVPFEIVRVLTTTTTPPVLLPY
jgi:hypothetical protein